MTDRGCVTFIVRVLRSEASEESAVVELVRTGQKERVYRLAAIGVVIAELARRDREANHEECL